MTDISDVSDLCQRLRSDLTTAEEEWEVMDQAADALEAQAQRIAELRKYAQHRHWCPAHPDDAHGDCTCGLDALLAEGGR